MVSSLLMKGLCIIYAVITAACIFEKNMKLALYWFGATIITMSIMLMRK